MIFVLPSAEILSVREIKLTAASSQWNTDVILPVTVQGDSRKCCQQKILLYTMYTCDRRIWLVNHCLALAPNQSFTILSNSTSHLYLCYPCYDNCMMWIYKWCLSSPNSLQMMSWINSMQIHNSSVTTINMLGFYTQSGMFINTIAQYYLCSFKWVAVMGGTQCQDMPGPPHHRHLFVIQRLIVYSCGCMWECCVLYTGYEYIFCILILYVVRQNKRISLVNSNTSAFLAPLTKILQIKIQRLTMVHCFKTSLLYISFHEQYIAIDYWCVLDGGLYPEYSNFYSWIIHTEKYL